MRATSVSIPAVTDDQCTRISELATDAVEALFDGLDPETREEIRAAIYYAAKSVLGITGGGQ